MTSEARKLSFGNLDNLDELGSFDGSDSTSPLRKQQRTTPDPLGSPTSSSSKIDYNPVGLTIGQISPGGRSTNSELSSFSRNQSHTTVNAVHMHIQENAKIPNFNKPVDRTNSSRPSYPAAAVLGETATSSSSTTRNAINDDFSMAELFLNKESKYRRSLDQNYSSLGTLLADEGFGGGGGGSTGGHSRRPSTGGSSTMSSKDGKNNNNDNKAMDETQMEIDALTAAIDPTPWSEIEQKMHKDEEKQHQQQRMVSHHPQQQQQQSLPIPSHPHHYSYYPYGRHHQLPIPQKSSPVTAPKPSPPPSSNGVPAPAPPLVSAGVLEQAVATAAAIASTQATTTTTTKSPPPPQQQQPPLPTSSIPTNATTAPPYTKAQQTTTTTTNNPTTTTYAPPSTIRNYHRQRATYAPPPHAGAHTTNRGSLIAAASQKSQYGFGGNHTVPSVPAPPPGPKNGRSRMLNNNLPNMPNLTMARGGGRGGPGKNPASKNTAASVTTTTSMQQQQQHPHLQHPPNNGAAYERKKQRAKDARVKLNDAIERLSVGMNFAGSQSKVRHKVLEETITNTNVRSKTLQVSDECAKLAEQAKKWDRPSFVGTAASLVQGLNTQCEALMNEITELDKQLKSALASSGGGSGGGGGVEVMTTRAEVAENGMSNGTSSNGNDSLTTHPDHKRHDHPSSSGMNGHSPTKRIKHENNNSTTTTTTTAIGGGIRHVTVSPDEKTVFKHVAKLLDPVTLCRCPCVSRNWRDMNVFENDDLWLDLAVKRFGFYNVRQWTEKMEDDNSTEVGTKKPSKKKIYRAMNAANIMPHVQQDSVSLLGDAKIPGRVSVWVFMVERSNGETLRSVKREPGSPTAGAGPYHSSPVVELRVVIQNTGMANYPIVLKNQSIAVDVSTRRSGGELKEISWDDRFAKVVRNLDGTIRKAPVKDSSKYPGGGGELCQLPLFDSTILEVHINARGCSTTSKFQQRSNFTKLLVFFDGTTVPMVIPFLRDPGH